MKNFLGTDIKWLWTMRRLNTVFSVSTYPTGSLMGTKVWNYPKPLSSLWYDNGEIYFEENEILCVKKFLEFNYQENNNYPDEIAKDIFSLVKKIKAQKISLDKNETLESLTTKFKKESIYFLTLIGYISYRGAVQMYEVLQDKLINIISFRAAQIDRLNDMKSYLEIFCVPLYDSVVIEEKLDALKLSIGFSNIAKEEQERRITEYLSNYEWLSYHWLEGISPTREEVKAKLLNLENGATQEITDTHQNKKNEEEKINTLTIKLKFNHIEKNLLKQFREWVFMRTFIKDNINLAGYKLIPILNQTASLANISSNEILRLTLDEILNITNIDKEVIKKNIADRKDAFSAGTINNVLIFEKFEKYSQNKETKKTAETKEIKGSIAFKGIVRGIVKIILFPKDQERLKEGDILVTSMTTPDFLPAMGRAVAFITDEGGITCHAAIVAREMKKPCVIGTKNATKILKDGDLVEVNALEGTVKIIPKS